MGVLHLLGGVLLFLVPMIRNNAVFLLGYPAVLAPIHANHRPLQQRRLLPDDPIRGKQFPWIRVFGTLGWIVAGTIIGALGLEKVATTFQIAAGASVLLGLFSFALPNTPPKGKESQAPGTEAFVLFKNKPYLIFFIAAILVCIPLSFYYGFANNFLVELA